MFNKMSARILGELIDLKHYVIIQQWYVNESDS